MKKVLVVTGTALVVVVLGLFAVGTALAEEPETSATPVPQTRWGGPWHRICAGAGIVSDAIADLLGMTPEEVLAQREAGKTLAEMAAAKGLADQDLAEAMFAAMKKGFDQAVAEGRVTWEQADRLFVGPRAAGPGPGGLRHGLLPGAVAELLDMTPEELWQEQADGKTLSQIAQEKGISDQQLIDAMLAAQKEAIEQALADGRITQEQADWLLERMEAMTPFELSNPFAPGKAGPGMRGGRWAPRMPWR